MKVMGTPAALISGKLNALLTIQSMQLNSNFLQDQPMDPN
jgi:hypothetical protein